MDLNPTDVIRALTVSSLAGLLFGVGLRLTFREVALAVMRCRLGLIFAVNFLVVPALAVALAKAFRLEPYPSTGLILLAAAPFAPVVPVFARLARADLALAAGLTSLVVVASALLTPFVCALALQVVAGTAEVKLRLVNVMLTLIMTIILPLAAGAITRRSHPEIGQRILRPIEGLAEACGALSLMYVTIHEFSSLVHTGWRSVLTVCLLSEISVVLGYATGGPSFAARQVVALGTGNRNIALALLIALENFAGTSVVAAVVANGFLLILLGLGHVALWRVILRDARRD